MRAVLQRVSQARVLVAEEEVGAIERGLLVFVGIADGDTETDVRWLSKKLLSLRVFPDEAGKMNLSVADLQGSLLLVSQFTLCADLAKGSRPSFGKAMAPAQAERLFNLLVRQVAETAPVATGRFGAHMQVELSNDGPVTLWLDSARGSS